ncbi:MAG: hypothetical protein WAQ98_11320 [Blastocatellia bacterium]
MTNAKHDERLKTSFSVTIDFEKDSPNGSRVFRAMSEMIDAFQQFDAHLLASVESTVQPVILLENVESGSIKVWLKQAVKTLLEKTDDDSLKKGEWKSVFGNYLMSAKYFILKKLENKTELTSRDIEVLEAELVESAEKTEVNKTPFYQPINKKQLIEDIANITNTTRFLTNGDKVTYDSPYGAVDVNITFHISPEQIEALIVEKTLTSQAPMVVKVKRPDFLGTAQWEFRYDGRIIVAKILDDKWLKEYQEGNITLRPQEALLVTMETTVKFDHEHEVIGTEYKILEVKEILPKSEQHQLKLLESGKPNTSKDVLGEQLKPDQAPIKPKKID